MTMKFDSRAISRWTKGENPLSGQMGRLVAGKKEQVTLDGYLTWDDLFGMPVVRVTFVDGGSVTVGLAGIREITV